MSILNISHEGKIIEYVDQRKAPNRAFEEMKKCFEECAQKCLTFEESYEKISDNFNTLKSSAFKSGTGNMKIDKYFQTSYYNDINSIYLRYSNEDVICIFNQYGKPKEKEDDEDGEKD